MRNTHPNLYKMYLMYAIGSIALGLNFLFLTPAFMPLEVTKWPIGLAFSGCGVIKLVLLLYTNNRTWLRLSMCMSAVIYSFWAGALTFDFFRLSQTSMQLPITYIILTALAYYLLVEPFINPVTNRNGNGNGK